MHCISKQLSILWLNYLEFLLQLGKLINSQSLVKTFGGESRHR